MRFPVPGLFIVVILVLGLCSIVPGCTTTNGSNLTVSELQTTFLDNASKIQDYRSEYTRTTGFSGGGLFTEKVRFDMKSPSSFWMQYIESPQHSPGSLWSSNGTITGYYDAAKRTYDISSGSDHLSEYDYQSMVRQIVKDGSFTITGKETIAGHPCYGIEVVADPYSDTYTHYLWSRIQAWIDPYSGLVWNISTYYPKDTVNNIIRYDTIKVNTGIPDRHFDFEPPEGASPRCNPKYANYIQPPRTSTSFPVDQPIPGIRFSLNESDSGRTISLNRGDIIDITLRTIPGLAYRWIMPAEGSGLALMNGGSIYEFPEPTDDHDLNFLSGRGYYRWRYGAVSPGTETFDGIFTLNGCDIQNSKRFNLTVNVV